MSITAKIYLDTDLGVNQAFIQKLKNVFKSKSAGFLIAEGFITITLKTLGASAFTGLMGVLGGLAIGCAIMFGLLPFLFSFLWKAFWNLF